MKILQIRMSNYRQYKGDNVVVMSSDSKKNVTIIQGNNGCGKSNFMNAITWCLYGEEMFKSNNEGREIINESALFDGKGEDVDVSVEVTLGNDKPDYKFQRSVTFSLEMQKPYVKKRDFRCYRIDQKRGWVYCENPETIVNSIFIKSSLKGFFFFDGEKMDKYFEDTKIKLNVEQIAQIDLIKDVIDTLSDVKRSIVKEKKNVSSEIEGINIGNDPEVLYEELKSFKKRKEDIEDRLEQEKKALKEISEYLEKNSYKDIRQLNNDRNKLEEEHRELTKQLVQTKNEQKNLVASSISIIFGYGALKRSVDLVDDGTKRGTLPPDIKDVFVRDLLSIGNCICGRKLDLESRKCLEKLLERIVPSSIACDSVRGRYTISGMIEELHFMRDYATLSTKIHNIEDELSENLCKKDGISSCLLNYNDEEIFQKEEKRCIVSDNIDKLNRELGRVDSDIDNKELDIKRSNEAFKKYQNIDRQLEYLINLESYVDAVICDICEVRDTIVEEVRKKLESKTKEYFFNMIWKKNAFSDVRIIDKGKDYRISVLSDCGQECLGDISAGERQILALSFTAALYSVIGHLVPVFIDTPLGRISGQSRLNVAECLPNYLSQAQMVILSTDTEYTPDVRNCLLPNVNKEYKIQYDAETKVSKVISYE